jgi:hypothetical protein
MGRPYNMGYSDIVPDTLMLGTVINANVYGSVVGASGRAAQLLLHMESLLQMGYGGAKLTTFVYNACMNAFAKDPLTGEGGGGGGGGVTNVPVDELISCWNVIKKQYKKLSMLL